ncbi:MAG: DUF5681 domain-containing protein [Candidatus Binatia bacterium]
MKTTKRRKPPNAHPNWKKGDPSPNPKGRPKNSECITAIIRKMLEEPCPHDKQKRKWKELVAEALLRLVVKGNSAAINNVMDRIEGKIPLPVTGSDGGPIEGFIKVKFVGNGDRES